MDERGRIIIKYIFVSLVDMYECMFDCFCAHCPLVILLTCLHFGYVFDLLAVTQGSKDVLQLIISELQNKRTLKNTQ